MATQAIILSQAQTIKDETVTDANTATRVGTNLENIANKVRPYTKYVALLTQTGTNDPTVKVLENDLGGTVVWTRPGPAGGSYKATLAGTFTADKTGWLIAPMDSNGYTARFTWNDADSITLVTADDSNVSTDGAMTDVLIEIRVYE